MVKESGGPQGPREDAIDRLRPAFLALTLALAGCAVAGPSNLEAAVQAGPAAIADPATMLSASEQALRRGRALQALDRYLETWNSRDPALWATSLAYPHVRPGAGVFEVYDTEAQYAAAQDFNRLLANGWRYTRWERRDVVQVGPRKVHVSGVWRRFAEDGSPQIASHIVYVVVPGPAGVEGPWRIQARFAAGVVSDLAVDQQAAIATSARAALDAYVAALNEHDVAAVSGAIHFPFVRLGDDGLESALTREAFLAGPGPGRVRTWATTRIRDVKLVGVTATGANFTLTFERSGVAGEVQSAEPALVLVSTAAGDPAWKVRAISTLGP